MILHFHYTTWPDFGVPQSPEAFYKFLNVVRASGVLEPDVGPVVVHCSAGIGRSGTFCLVDTILMMVGRIRQDLCYVVSNTRHLLTDLKNHYKREEYYKTHHSVNVHHAITYTRITEALHDAFPFFIIFVTC